MGDVGLAALAGLAVVCERTEPVGLVDALDLVGRQVGPQALQ